MLSKSHAIPPPVPVLFLPRAWRRPMKKHNFLCHGPRRVQAAWLPGPGAPGHPIAPGRPLPGPGHLSYVQVIVIILPRSTGGSRPGLGSPGVTVRLCIALPAGRHFNLEIKECKPDQVHNVYGSSRVHEKESFILTIPSCQQILM